MDIPQKFDLFYFEHHFEKGGCRFETEDHKVSMYEHDNCYEIQVEPKSPFLKVCTQALYNADTLSLMKKGNFLKHGGLPIGVWSEYDEFGELTEEVDEDEGMKIKWKDMEEILIKNEIPMDSIVDINKELFGEDMYLWKIMLSQSGSSMVLLTFSADTGELFFTDVLNRA